jgi:predicted ATPase
MFAGLPDKPMSAAANPGKVGASYELIAGVLPMPQAQLDDALTQLTASGLAFRRGTPPDAIYTLKHSLVLDAAYDSLLKSRRQELHAKIARVIETRSEGSPT